MRFCHPLFESILRSGVVVLLCTRVEPSLSHATYYSHFRTITTIFLDTQ